MKFKESDEGDTIVLLYQSYVLCESSSLIKCNLPSLDNKFLNTTLLYTTVVVVSFVHSVLRNLTWVINCSMRKSIVFYLSFSHFFSYVSRIKYTRYFSFPFVVPQCPSLDPKFLSFMVEDLRYQSFD